MAAFCGLTIVWSCFVLSLGGSSQSKGWRKIVPLVSTRADVERLFGPCSKGNHTSCLYETGSEIVEVTYSDGPCESGWPFGYNIPVDTVEWIRVSPMTYVHVGELDFKLDTFEKRVKSDGSLMYVNDQQGIAVWVFDGKVGSLIYGSTTKQAHLRCPSSVAPKMPKGTDIAGGHSDVVEYGDISLDEERKYLDRFAKQLKRQSTVQGYIITYAGQRSFANEAHRRLQCQKDYLIRKRGVEPGRITTIDGGYHSSRKVELYVLLRGGHVPVPYPTIRPSQVEIVKENGVVGSSLCTVPPS